MRVENYAGATLPRVIAWRFQGLRNFSGAWRRVTTGQFNDQGNSMIMERVIGWALIIASSASVCAVFSLQMFMGFVMEVIATVGAAVVVSDSLVERHECLGSSAKEER
jgi:hypothetical protein